MRTATRKEVTSTGEPDLFCPMGVHGMSKGHNPGDRRRRREGITVSGAMTGPPCDEGTSIKGPGPPGLGGVERKTDDILLLL
jgi:hypothetical protein